jgi:hypothetical protein
MPEKPSVASGNGIITIDQKQTVSENTTFGATGPHANGDFTKRS